MTGQPSLLTRVLDFFRGLLFRNSRSAEAEALRQRMVSVAAALERGRPAFGPPVHEALGSLSRLVFMAVNKKGIFLAGQSGLVADLQAFAHELGDADPAYDALLLAEQAMLLTDRLASLLDPAAEGREDGHAGLTLRERLVLSEIRDLATALGKRETPAEVRDVVVTVRDLALRVAEECEKQRGHIERTGKFCKKYLTAAIKIVDGLHRARQQQPEGELTASLTTRSADILQRIAEAFRSEHRYLENRGRENLDIDLTVLDALLRMDGK